MGEIRALNKPLHFLLQAWQKPCKQERECWGGILKSFRALSEKSKSFFFPVLLQIMNGCVAREPLVPTLCVPVAGRKVLLSKREKFGRSAADILLHAYNPLIPSQGRKRASDPMNESGGRN